MDEKNTQRKPALVIYEIEDTHDQVSHIELLTENEFTRYQTYIGRRSRSSYCCGQTKCIRCLLDSDIKIMSVSWYNTDHTCPALFGTYNDLDDVFDH